MLQLRKVSERRENYRKPKWIDPSKGVERLDPWALERLPQVLRTLEKTRRNEERLYAASALRKMLEVEGHRAIQNMCGTELHLTEFLAIFAWIIRMDADVSITIRRCQIHMLYCLRYICEFDTNIDIRLCHDEDLMCCLLDTVIHSGHYDFEAVVIAMEIVAVLVKDIAENQALLCHRRGFLDHYTFYLTESTAGHVVYYALYTFLYVSRNPRNHFILARYRSLVEIILVVIQHAEEDFERCLIVLQILRNLLLSRENAMEIDRCCPTNLVQEMIHLHHTCHRINQEWVEMRSQTQPPDLHSSESIENQPTIAISQEINSLLRILQDHHLLSGKIEGNLDTNQKAQSSNLRLQHNSLSQNFANQSMHKLFQNDHTPETDQFEANVDWNYHEDFSKQQPMDVRYPIDHVAMKPHDAYPENLEDTHKLHNSRSERTSTSQTAGGNSHTLNTTLESVIDRRIKSLEALYGKNPL